MISVCVYLQLEFTAWITIMSDLFGAQWDSNRKGLTFKGRRGRPRDHDVKVTQVVVVRCGFDAGWCI